MSKILARVIFGAFLLVFVGVLIGLPLSAAREEFGGWWPAIKLYSEILIGGISLATLLTWAAIKSFDL